jgi:hypothetical protein
VHITPHGIWGHAVGIGWSQVVEAFVFSGTGVELVGRTVRAYHDDGREVQLEVCRWIREAQFNARHCLRDSGSPDAISLKTFLYVWLGTILSWLVVDLSKENA